MRNILFFGPPGVGKGTNAIKIAQMFNLKHFSTGDKIRQECEKKTKFGLYSKRLIDVGKLVPNEILIPQVREWIMEEWNDNGFVFDGYPRSVEQSKDLDVFLRARKKPITHFFYFKATKEILRERLKKRGEISKREDDDPKFFDDRYNSYLKGEQAILNYFNGRSDVKYFEIDSNKKVDEIIKEINDKLLNL